MGSNLLNRWLVLIASLLLLPALLINLGLNPLFAVNDEAIRILVAQEMHLSGDYISPTTFGDPYLRKPPLFNWLVILSSFIASGFSEFSLRIVSVISLLAFAFLIFRYTSRHFERWQAATIALAVVTSGRILFFDSFLGLIDITHGMVIFWNFMLIYHLSRKEKYWQMFLASYLLTAIAFLMKGLPAIVFQGITLLTYFLYTKNFRRILSLPHAGGILIFLLLIGSYYAAYLYQNNLEFTKLFNVLLDQSTQRTGIEHGIGRTIEHMAVFPFELLYHFAPWTLMVVFLFRKGAIHNILDRPFLKFCAIIFIANMCIYWISPGVFARYFFMMVPLLFIIFFQLYSYEKRVQPHSWRIRVVDIGFLGLVIAAVFTLPVALFLPEFRFVDQAWLKLALVWVPLTALAFVMYRLSEHRFLLMVIALLFIRIAFNFFILPERAMSQSKYLAGVKKVPVVTKGYKLFIYKNNYLLQEADVFYINQGRGDQLTRIYNDFPQDALYLVDDRQYDPGLFQEEYVYACKWYDLPVRVCRMRVPGGRDDVP